MKKLTLVSTGIVIICFVIGFINYTRGHKVHTNNVAVYQFASLQAKTAAQISFKKELNGKKQWDIFFEDILDEHYKSLSAKKQELLFLAAYEQFIGPRSGKVQKVSVKMEKLRRDLAVVCTQYGIRCEGLDKIVFNPQQKEFLVVDGESFTLSKLQQKTVPLLAVKTEILNHVLQKIDDTLRNKMLYFVAKNAGLSAQDFVDQKVISETAALEAAKLEVERLLPEGNTAGKAQMVKWMKDVKKNEATNAFLRTNYIHLPIVVNVEQPQNDFKTRWEWTPYFGADPEDAVAVVLFTDFFSDASRTQLRSYLRYTESNFKASFGWRPYFHMNDQLEWVAAELSMCVWSKQKSIFWKYMAASLNASREKVEADLYDAVKSVGGDPEVTKKCLVSREMKKVVEYHLQSAKYLKIINPPVIFVGNEVHIGPFSAVDFEKMLARQPHP